LEDEGSHKLKIEKLGEEIKVDLYGYSRSREK
jgi:hypothetical protein